MLAGGTYATNEYSFHCSLSEKELVLTANWRRRRRVMSMSGASCKNGKSLIGI